MLVSSCLLHFDHGARLVTVGFGRSKERRILANESLRCQQSLDFCNRVMSEILVYLRNDLAFRFLGKLLAQIAKNFCWSHDDNLTKCVRQCGFVDLFSDREGKPFL
jgi:hypothetical protein